MISLRQTLTRQPYSRRAWHILTTHTLTEFAIYWCWFSAAVTGWFPAPRTVLATLISMNTFWISTPLLLQILHGCKRAGECADERLPAGRRCTAQGCSSITLPTPAGTNSLLPWELLSLFSHLMHEQVLPPLQVTPLRPNNGAVLWRAVTAIEHKLVLQIIHVTKCTDKALNINKNKDYSTAIKH